MSPLHSVNLQEVEQTSWSSPECEGGFKKDVPSTSILIPFITGGLNQDKVNLDLDSIY